MSPLEDSEKTSFSTLSTPDGATAGAPGQISDLHAEMAETIKQAKRAGVKARPVGASAVETENEQFARLVDQHQRLATLLQAVVDNAGSLSDEMLLEIRHALADGDRSSQKEP